MLFEGLSLDGGDDEAAEEAVDDVVSAKLAVDSLGISDTASRLMSVALVNLIFQLLPIEGSRMRPNCC